MLLSVFQLPSSKPPTHANLLTTFMGKNGSFIYTLEDFILHTNVLNYLTWVKTLHAVIPIIPSAQWVEISICLFKIYRFHQREFWIWKTWIKIGLENSILKNSDLNKNIQFHQRTFGFRTHNSESHQVKINNSNVRCVVLATHLAFYIEFTKTLFSRLGPVMMNLHW